MRLLIGIGCLLLVVLGIFIGMPLGASIQSNDSIKLLDFANIIGTWVGAIATAFAAGLALWLQRKADSANIENLNTIFSAGITLPDIKVFTLKIVSTGQKPVKIQSITIQMPDIKLDLWIRPLIGSSPIPVSLQFYSDDAIYILPHDKLIRNLSCLGADARKLRLNIITTTKNFNVDITDTIPYLKEQIENASQNGYTPEAYKYKKLQGVDIINDGI